jgi:hypothetical protein
MAHTKPLKTNVKQLINMFLQFKSELISVKNSEVLAI